MIGSVSIVALGVILLAAIVHATLQVALGSLLLLFHASMGKHIRKKTRTIVADFISGAYILIVLILAAICFLVQNAMDGQMSLELLAGIAGILIALAICSWVFYYKTGRTTELWIPRALSRYINNRAKKTESNAESFSLGMLTAFAEIPFSLVLMAVAAGSVMELPYYMRPAAVLLYALVAVFPMLVMRFATKTGKTVVEIQKWRVKNKIFLRIMTGFLFLTLAAFIIVFKIIG